MRNNRQIRWFSPWLSPVIWLVWGLSAFAQQPTSSPATQAATPSAPQNNVFSVKDFGAIGDGLTDDSAAFNAARAAACAAHGTFYVPPTAKSYRLTTSLQITLAGCSGSTFDFNHALIRFAPQGPPWIGPVNDRLLYIESNYGLPHQVSQAIAIGDTSFTAAAPEQTADLEPGDWLIVREFDAGIGDIVSFDWVQVESVTGRTVAVQHPFRVAFSVARPWTAAQSGSEFVKITSLLRGVTIRNCNFVQGDAGRNLPTIHVGVALQTVVSNCLVENSRGQALYIYQAKDVVIDSFRSVNGGSVSSELAASVDVVVRNSAFGVERAGKRPALALTSPLTLDFGTAFFSLADNHFCSAGNIGVQVLYGVHDGTFTANYLGPVRAATIKPVGIVGRGVFKVKVAGNTFAGADLGGVAIDFGDTGTLSVNITTAGNVVGENRISGFTTHFGPKNKHDAYPAKSKATKPTASVAAAAKQKCIL